MISRCLFALVWGFYVYHGENDSTAGYELVEVRLGDTTECLEGTAARHGAVGVE
jgi:hypothetical protein